MNRESAPRGRWFAAEAVLSWRGHAFATVLAVALIVSRRPEDLLNPQLWSEDGTVFYPDAHNLGLIASLFKPHVGYLVVWPRLVAAAGLLLPLRWAPLLYTLAAIVIPLASVNLLLSRRLAAVIPHLAVRALFAFLILAVPASVSVHANLPNAQTHLSVLAFLVIASTPARNWGWRTFDAAVLVLAALTGPQSLLLLPTAGLLLWRDFDRERAVRVGILAIACAAQLACVLLTEAMGQRWGGLGITPERAVKLIGGNVVLTSLIGSGGVKALLAAGGPESLESDWYLVLCWLTVLAGAAAVAAAVWRGPLALRGFLLFAALVAAAGLVFARRDPGPHWATILAPGSLHQYGYIIHLAMMVTMAWLAVAAPWSAARVAGRVAMAVMCLGIALDWVYPPLPDLDFAQHCAAFEQAAPGERVIIPVNPQGFFLDIVKR